MDQMQYNLLFRWFVGLGINDPVWSPTVFTKNRDCFAQHCPYQPTSSSVAG
ncbi:Transposase domain [Paracoccus saliphilus]|uniref:Transposase domain n=1 Tax=Paracoccus saliphilus TaxID=405559 RepID=A0AA46A7J4_9RHOB|nr:Transposase domain [Paracoccus saliphilus]